MFRKKRIPGPHFKMPGAPFAPIKGERAPLGRNAVKGTTLGIFQVIGDDPEDPDTADTHDNYVVCRGYEAETDPNFQFLYDPYTNDAPDAKAIHVAKPFGIRGTFPYVQGQLLVAARINTKLGYTPGKAATTVGHPADLDEEVEILLDDDDVAISWIDLTAITPAMQMVQVNHSGGTAGHLKEPNASNVHPGRIVTFTNGTKANSTDTWILFVDHYDTDSGDVIVEQGRFYGPAILSGKMTVSTVERPLYVCHVSEHQYLAKATGDVTKGNSGTFNLYHASTEADSGLMATAKCKFNDYTANKWAIVTRINGQYYANQIECD